MSELHCENAKRVQKLLPPEETSSMLAHFFKAFSDPTRVQILFCMTEGEICVHDISVLLGISQPRVSNQLRHLRQDKLVKTRKDGNQIFYSLDDEHIKDILEVGFAHIKH